MADYGLQVCDSQGRVTFDSRNASGGVCLGIYNINSQNYVLTYPDLGPGLQGFAMNSGGEPVWYTYDNNLGYPRFTFMYAVGIVAIFVK
jgi:hypothetical protein